MTPEKINARFKELCEMEEKLKAEIEVRRADLIAVNGAKQDCQFWLSEVAKSVVAEVKIDESGFEDTTKMITEITVEE